MIEGEQRLSREGLVLIEAARGIIEECFRRDGAVHHTLGCALYTPCDHLYTGINMDIQSCAPASICAEQDALFQMVKGEDFDVSRIVTYKLRSGNGHRSEDFPIISPCGRCIEILGHFGDPYLIVTRQESKDLCEVQLSDFVRNRYLSR